MTRLYIVRHAEAEGNLFRRIHGQYDTTLTVNGLRQVEALRDRFAGENVDACYSSDLVRTRTTAQAVWVPKGLPLRLEPRFREVALGCWEDVPFGQLEREEPEMMARFSADPYHWRVEGAETVEQYSGRFLAALEEVARAHDGQTVAIFTHGCVIRAMEMRLFYGPDRIPEIAHCDNTGVSLLEYEGGRFRSVYLNDNSHLPPELSTFARQNWWRQQGTRKDRNLWFRPLGDRDWYAACRREAWRLVYGDDGDCDGAAFYRDALAGAAGGGAGGPGAAESGRQPPGGPRGLPVPAAGVPGTGAGHPVGGPGGQLLPGQGQEPPGAGGVAGQRPGPGLLPAVRLRRDRHGPGPLRGAAAPGVERRADPGPGPGAGFRVNPIESASDGWVRGVFDFMK